MIDTEKIKNIFNKLFTLPHIIAATFLFLILITAGKYGIFGDELYYIACSKHLAWGTVDHPPFVDFMAFLSLKLFGKSLFAFRMLSGLCGAVTILISARIAKSLGGNRFAQSLSALMILCSLVFLAVCSFLSMNCFDLLFCSLFMLFFIRIIQNPNPGNWIILGIILGLGLLNKYTFLVLGFAWLVSLIVTRRWHIFKSPWLYISGMIGLLMFLPHIIWQYNHGWPVLEFMYNATTYKNLSTTIPAFFIQVIVALNPVTFPIWISGLFYLLFSKKMKKYRVLGWTILIFLVIYTFLNSKFYYVTPIFPLLLISGAIAVEWFIRKFNVNWLKGVIITLLIVSGLIILPLSIPVLPVDKFIDYIQVIGLRDQLRMENNESENLPIHFVYRFGWEELVSLVSEVYHTLPEKEKADCAIMASWYGPAGAIDYFGPQYGLPQAICAHNNYWIWGYDDYTGERVVTVGINPEYLKQMYNQVKVAAYFEHPYAYNQTICICRELKYPLKDLWPKLKNYG